MVLIFIFIYFEWRDTENQQLNGEDTFVSLPTGHGKSLIYHLALSVSKHLGLLSEVPIVLVISPLNVLIDDQIASVTKLGITVCKLDASSLEDTVSLAGHEILFTSPEELETGGARKFVRITDT